VNTSGCELLPATSTNTGPCQDGGLVVAAALQDADMVCFGVVSRWPTHKLVLGYRTFNLSMENFVKK